VPDRSQRRTQDVDVRLATPDLDIEPLEVFEERLCEYKGTLIVVCPDRKFLDNVVTSTLVLLDNLSQNGHL